MHIMVVNEDELMRGQFLKKLRLDQGITQQELANRAEVDRRTVGRIEAGGRFKWDTMLVLLNQLGCHVQIERRILPTTYKIMEVYANE